MCISTALKYLGDFTFLSVKSTISTTDPDGTFAKVLYDLTTASSLTAFTPHQLLHPPFSASPTLRFLFFQYTSLHKIISSMRVETWAFYKRLHPLNQEQCRAHLYSLSKNRLNERWCFLSLLFINNSSYTLSVKPNAYSMSHLHENSEGKHRYPYHADEEAESQEGYISRPGS